MLSYPIIKKIMYVRVHSNECSVMQTESLAAHCTVNKCM